MRSRIDWKYLLGLELTDTGCDHTVLSEFRTRLVQPDAVTPLFEVLLRQFQALGLLTAHGRQRTDSTHVLAAISALNRLELVGEAMRAALHSLVEDAPVWLRVQMPSAWYTRYGARLEDDRLPKDKAKRSTLAETIGADGIALLHAIRGSGGPVRSPAPRVAICFLRSAKRTRTCLATREGGKVAAKATACSQSSWGIRSEGCVRVWRQCANCAANWSSWWSPCNGVVIVMFASQSSGSCSTDDCRPAKIEFHARWSEAD